MNKLPVPLAFDWNEGNRNKNIIKHNVQFKESEEIFFKEPLRIFPDITHSIKEKRFLALGVTNQQRKLAIAFTIRDNKIRVISARDQNRKERNKYENQKS